MSANWESLEPERDPGVDPAERTRFLGAWNEHRRIYGYTLLQELPYALRKALRDHPDLEGVGYDLLVVDEYQDLNSCDLEVIKLIGERGCSVIGAGDDDQSIYSFRKAAPEGIRRFLDDYPGASDYTLSITQRCGSRIIEWASHVIEGDPDRPARSRLTPAAGSPPGRSHSSHSAATSPRHAESRRWSKGLSSPRTSRRAEILVLLRSDFRGTFSDLIKRELDMLSIPYADPEIVDRMLADADNRRMLEVFRLLVHREDSLAWASLLTLAAGIGDSFFDSIYRRARDAHSQFGTALMAAYADGFPDVATPVANRARILIESVLEWLDKNPVPEDRDVGWGQWIIDAVGDEVVAGPSEELRELLLALDELAEPDVSLGRYLGQIAPLGRDRAANESAGIRIMTMAGAKGLTVRATIIAALEEGLIPRPGVDLHEERRLLYVAMTRAREFVYGTWARRRTGPTARAGFPRVMTRRSHSSFLNSGPVESQDGDTYLQARWG